MSLTAVTLRDTSGAVEGVLVTAVDVSERKASSSGSADLAEPRPADRAGQPAQVRRRSSPRTWTAVARYGAAAARCCMLDLDHFKEVNDTLGHAPATS